MGKWSLSHERDMQAATSHVQRGEETEEATIGEESDKIHKNNKTQIILYPYDEITTI